MCIIDKYVFRSIARTFLWTVVIFCFLYILVDVTSRLDEFIDRRVPIKIIVLYYFYFSPVILSQMSSVACLISVLLTYSGLSNNNEIIAMRSHGMTFWQIAKPAICFSILVTTAIFWLNDRFIPYSNQMTKTLETEYLILEADRYTQQFVKIENLTFYGFKNRLFYIESYNPKTNELSGITIIEHDQNQNVKEKTVAFKGSWTGIAWKFYQCQITTYDEAGLNQPVKVKIYDEKLMDIQETPQDFLKQRVHVAAMNLQELRSYIARFANSGATKAIANLRIDWHQKISYPIGNFVIVLAGLPFVLMLKSRKGMTFASLGIAILVGFLYYVTNALFIAFGKGGLFVPIMSAWSAPVAFVLVALVVINLKFS